MGRSGAARKMVLRSIPWNFKIQLSIYLIQQKSLILSCTYKDYDLTDLQALAETGKLTNEDMPDIEKSRYRLKI